MWPTKHILFLYDKVNRRRLLGEYTDLVRNYNIEFNPIHDYQQDYLKSIFEYAAGNVPFYRRVFNECRLNNATILPLEVLNKLPLVTKELVNTNFDDFLSDEYRNNKQLTYYYTGG